MRIEILTVPDCQNGPVLADRVAVALAGGPSAEVVHRVVGDETEAARRGMHGSPTLLIDGRDPFAEPGTPPSLSCRLYAGPDGTISGAPTARQLRDAFRACAGMDPGAAARAAGRGGRGRVAPAERGVRAVYQAVLHSFAATGAAPTTAELEPVAAPYHLPAAQVLAELAAEDFLTLDDSGLIRAAYPFSAVPTGVQVAIAGGPTVWSMCAIDALGIPVMLEADAVITSADPVTGAPIRVEFAGGRASWHPEMAVVYYGTTGQLGPSASVCCGYLRFFTDHAGARAWDAAHPEVTGVVLDQHEAERLGADIFGALLRQPPAGSVPTPS